VSPRSATQNVFSVDLEDWYQGLEIDSAQWAGFQPRVDIGVRVLLELLDAAGVSATFFVLGYQAELTPTLIREVADRGHEIASHGYAHRFIYSQTPAEFRTDIRRAKDVVEQIVGRRVRGYRAPFFSITTACLWALDVLAEEGFVYDSSIFPVMNYRYGMPGAERHAGPLRTPAGATLYELPLSTVPLRVPRRGTVNVPAGGGGYFRLYPYAVTKALMRRVERQGSGAVFYVHPWEYDPDHPRVRLPRLMPQLTHYLNLRSTASKTRRLLADFRFTTVEGAYGGEIPRG
jgi:polysaccharide deacetylase family protein (PEP-CTERM system associated)